MIRTWLLTIVICTLLTACSTESRMMWGRAFQQAGQDIRNTRTVYCTTRYHGTTSYTSCY